MKKRVLFVVTSHGQKGNTGEQTGFYLSEVSHPWEVLIHAGYEIDFVSPKGGKAPIDGLNLGDAVNKKFWNDPVYRYKVEHTFKPEDIHPEQYVAIHYAGGHGAMWDFSNNTAIAKIAADIYEKGGVVSAVCHGPAGLLNVKLSNGKYLVQGKKVNAFTNEEEAAVKLDKVVPFLLESMLIERGGIFEKSGLWQPHVVADQRLVTGQNPQSAKAVGETLLDQLKHINVVGRLIRYEVKPEYREAFKKLVSNYVRNAVGQEGNILSEAYYEDANPSLIWIIERWSNKDELYKISKRSGFKAIEALSGKSLLQPAEVIYIKDLEPLSRQAWGSAAKKGDKPITIMLFVDSKAGTEDDFKDIYHIAMPQFRSEPGVITYQLSQLKGDSTRFVTYEKFRNEDAFQYHLAFPPIQPVIDYLNTSIKTQPFQNGLHRLIGFAPLIRE